MALTIQAPREFLANGIGSNQQSILLIQIIGLNNTKE